MSKYDSLKFFLKHSLKIPRLNLCPKNKFMSQDEIKIVGNKKEKINKGENDF